MPSMTMTSDPPPPRARRRVEESCDPDVTRGGVIDGDDRPRTHLHRELADAVDVQAPHELVAAEPRAVDVVRAADRARGVRERLARARAEEDETGARGRVARAAGGEVELAEEGREGRRHGQKGAERREERRSGEEGAERREEW